jgi:hypothetical protein
MFVDMLFLLLHIPLSQNRYFTLLIHYQEI